MQTRLLKRCHAEALSNANPQSAMTIIKMETFSLTKTTKEKQAADYAKLVIMTSD